LNTESGEPLPPPPPFKVPDFKLYAGALALFLSILRAILLMFNFAITSLSF